MPRTRTGQNKDKQQRRSKVLLETEEVGVFLDTISALLVLLAGDTSLGIFGNFLLEEVGLRIESSKIEQREVEQREGARRCCRS